MEREICSFEATIEKNPEMDAAYVLVPLDIRAAFGKGRLSVRASFDGVLYDGSVVNMGVKDAAGNIRYLIGLRKDIRARIGKGPGDRVAVTLWEREARKGDGR